MKWILILCTLIVGDRALAGGDTTKPTYPGTIVYAHAGSIMALAPSGTSGATELAKLPEGEAAPVWIEANPDGTLISVQLAHGAAWLVKGESDLKSGACTGRARPAPNGACLVCAGDKSWIMVNAAKPEIVHELPSTLREVSFLGPTPPDLAALADEGVVGFERKSADQHRLLGKPGKASHLLVSPDGSRAVAIIGDGDDSRVYTFDLDGEGVPRRIGGPGTPTAWSADSAWVIVQEGTLPPEGGGEDAGEARLDDRSIFGVAAKKPPAKKTPPKTPPKAPPKKKPAELKTIERAPAVRTCIVRATGGESKCWDGFTGLALSPDSAFVLLERGGSLFIGTMAGVRPEPPRKLVDGADGAATWIP
jgi:hypothetical protein